MSESIFQVLSVLQESGAARQLSQQLGTDEAATSQAISAALPALVAGVSRRAAQGDGAAALVSMLDRDGDGSILDDMLGSLAGAGAAPQGGDVLGDLLGPGRGQVESQIGRSSGLDAGTVARIMAALAPLVLGALSRARENDHLDGAGLQQRIGAEQRRLEVEAPGGLSAFERMLDMDGDGDIGDDVAQLGAQVLGGLFRR
ncbi:MAG: DUF937 domain-containing protein [Myxococcales bacterium]|nr:DUF937 domain-containing protein [Myxococcales bacterium]